MVPAAPAPAAARPVEVVHEPLAVLRVAFRALGRNTMRSFLTGVGIIIGVAAFIAWS